MAREAPALKKRNWKERRVFSDVFVLPLVLRISGDLFVCLTKIGLSGMIVLFVGGWGAFLSEFKTTSGCFSVLGSF